LKHTFDGRVEQGRREGWSIGQAVGEPHWAAFALEKPVADSGPSVVKVTLQHRFEAPYEIGRFRLWVTTNAVATAGGLPQEIAGILQVPPNSRNSKQTARLLEHYRDLDPNLRKQEQTLALARKPPPEDERLKELELNLARASKPVEVTPQLAQLRADVELSTRQLKNKRLTAAQDLAWALINTPSFLFNR
jgi:hypothetical protein